jgi:antitoxin MazE
MYILAIEIGEFMALTRVKALQRWGNSIGVRIPKEIMGKAQMAEGDKVEFEVASPGVIVLRAGRLKPTLNELTARLNPENQHAEIAWGKPVGDEVW